MWSLIVGSPRPITSRSPKMCHCAPPTGGECGSILVIEPQLRDGHRARDHLHVRGGHEQSVRVARVQRVRGGGIHDQHTPERIVEPRIIQQRVDALSQLSDLLRARRLERDGVARRWASDRRGRRRGWRRSVRARGRERGASKACADHEHPSHRRGDGCGALRRRYRTTAANRRHHDHSIPKGVPAAVMAATPPSGRPATDRPVHSR